MHLEVSTSLLRRRSFSGATLTRATVFFLFKINFPNESGRYKRTTAQRTFKFQGTKT
jgi:hypothetical protein